MEVQQVTRIEDEKVLLGQFPAAVRGAIKQFREENGFSFLSASDLISRREALEQYFAWEGIIGYTEDVIGIFDTAKYEG